MTEDFVTIQVKLPRSDLERAAYLVGRKPDKLFQLAPYLFKAAIAAVDFIEKGTPIFAKFALDNAIREIKKGD